MKKGTTKECLDDFFKRFGKSDQLIDFTQVTRDTEGRWRNKGIMPKGQILLRIRHFLHLCGYEVAELQSLSPTLFEMGQGAALGCFTLSDIAKKTHVEGGYDQLLGYLRGDCQPTQNREEALEEIVRQNCNAIKHERENMQTVLKKAGMLNLASANNGEPENLIEAFEHACKKVLNLANQLKTGPLEERAAMRRRMGVGQEPLLHNTWEALKNLLHEQTH